MARSRLQVTAHAENTYFLAFLIYSLSRFSDRVRLIGALVPDPHPSSSYCAERTAARAYHNADHGFVHCAYTPNIPVRPALQF